MEKNNQKTLLEQVNFGSIEHDFTMKIERATLVNIVVSLFFIFVLYFVIKGIFVTLIKK